MHAYIVFVYQNGRLSIKTAMAQSRLFAVYGVLSAFGGVCVMVSPIPICDEVN